MTKVYVWIGVFIIVLTSGIFFMRTPKGASMSEQPIPTVVESMKKLSPPSMEIDPNKMYTATLQTSIGDITISLNAKATPKTVNNFVYLSRQKFYDASPFHRVIKGFMIQGGDPEGTGRGGPGYRFDDESFTGEYKRGTVAMANAGPNTNGSQFFIMHEDYPLPKNYVIFGTVIEGMNVVDTIATAETVFDGRENSKPKTPVTIQGVAIIEK